MSDADQEMTVRASEIVCRAVPLWMTDTDTTAWMAYAALDLSKEASVA